MTVALILLSLLVVGVAFYLAVQTKGFWYVLAICLLFAFPIGTIIGIWLLNGLSNGEWERAGGKSPIKDVAPPGASEHTPLSSQSLRDGGLMPSPMPELYLGKGIRDGFADTLTLGENERLLAVVEGEESQTRRHTILIVTTQGGLAAIEDVADFVTFRMTDITALSASEHEIHVETENATLRITAKHRGDIPLVEHRIRWAVDQSQTLEALEALLPILADFGVTPSLIPEMAEAISLDKSEGGLRDQFLNDPQGTVTRLMELKSAEYDSELEALENSSVETRHQLDDAVGQLREQVVKLLVGLDVPEELVPDMAERIVDSRKLSQQFGSDPQGTVLTLLREHGG